MNSHSQNKKIIKLSINTPGKIIYYGEVYSITIPSTSGVITILPDHMPLIATIEKGEIHIKTSLGDDRYFAIYKGVLKIHNNECSILSSNIDAAEEINAEFVRGKCKHIEEKIKEAKEQNKEYIKLIAELEKELNKINVAERRQYRSRQ